MDTEEAWQQFQKSQTGVAKSVTDDNNTQNLRTMLEMILANQHEIMTNTQRTADLVPKILGDEGAMDAANDQAGMMAAMGGGMPPGGAPPMGGAPPGAEGGMPPEMGGMPPAGGQGGGDMSEDEINQILAGLGGGAPEGGAPAPGAEGMPGGAPGGAPPMGGEGELPPEAGAPEMGAPEAGAPGAEGGDSMESIKDAIKQEIQAAMDEGNYKAAKELVDALESIESYEEESAEGLEDMGAEGGEAAGAPDLGAAGAGLGGLSGAGTAPAMASANKGSVKMSGNTIRKTGEMPAEGGAEAPADAGATAPVAECKGGAKEAVMETNSELSKKGQESVGKTTAGQRVKNAQAGMRAANQMLTDKNKITSNDIHGTNKQIDNAVELTRRAGKGVQHNAEGMVWEKDVAKEVEGRKDDTNYNKAKKMLEATKGKLKGAKQIASHEGELVYIRPRKTTVGKSAMPSFRDMVNFHMSNPGTNVYDRGLEIRKAMDGELPPTADGGMPPEGAVDIPEDDVPVDDAPIEEPIEEEGGADDIIQLIADYCEANGITEEQLAAMSDEEIAEIVRAALGGGEEEVPPEGELPPEEELADVPAEEPIPEAEPGAEDVDDIGKSESGIQSADCACKGMNGGNSLNKDVLASASEVHKEVNKNDMGTSHSVDGVLQSGGALDKDAIQSARATTMPPAQTGLTINKSGGREIMSMRELMEIRKSSSSRPDFRCSTNGDISRPEITPVAKSVGADPVKTEKTLEGFKKSAARDLEQYKAYKQAQRERII